MDPESPGAGCSPVTVQSSAGVRTRGSFLALRIREEGREWRRPPQTPRRRSWSAPGQQCPHLRG